MKTLSHCIRTESYVYYEFKAGLGFNVPTNFHDNKMIGIWPMKIVGIMIHATLIEDGYLNETCNAIHRASTR